MKFTDHEDWQVGDHVDRGYDAATNGIILNGEKAYKMDCLRYRVSPNPYKRSDFRQAWQDGYDIGYKKAIGELA